MNNERTQRWRVSSPKTISEKTFKLLVDSLNDFMPGLETTKRVIRTKVIADGQSHQEEGIASWKVYQPFPFEKIEQLQYELTLYKTENTSCELHVEFRKNQILLSVSDIDTGWRDAIFEEIERNLKNNGVFKGELIDKITSTIVHLQNVFLILGSNIYILAYIDPSINFKYFAFSLITIGAIPIIGDIYRLYFPTKPMTVLESKVVIPLWNIEKIAMWIGLLSGVVTLIKELIPYMKFLK